MHFFVQRHVVMVYHISWLAELLFQSMLDCEGLMRMHLIEGLTLM